MRAVAAGAGRGLPWGVLPGGKATAAATDACCSQLTQGKGEAPARGRRAGQCGNGRRRRILSSNLSALERIVVRMTHARLAGGPVLQHYTTPASPLASPDRPMPCSARQAAVVVSLAMAYLSVGARAFSGVHVSRGVSMNILSRPSTPLKPVGGVPW